ncbi:DMT family transporter [Saccharothrix texasensis]|uniref:Quaternary ammonium compound-resistance protein SugE n=1 Tax=Saccharothrix texasensis TaxID=103734 RepID=A0A3N1HAY5_9PSEU|nr:multidrug efflux SMR transporter [Saccharothrix texasensis]ROP39596.1 quaternary ammonium compound-resistance protein SugE [Saccharothrix texasensis]
MAWLLLLGAASLEVVWATAVGRSAGFTRPWPTGIGIAAAVTSFAMLAIAMRDLPVGTAYAVWVGLGAVGVVLVGICAGESASPWRLACLALIVLGVVGLKLT